MFKLSKSFDFCYGHRVFSQDVNGDYAENDECPCHRQHGHAGNVTVHMETEVLDHRGFVIDFKELGFVKMFFNNYIDHRFILSTQDPNFRIILGLGPDDDIPPMTKDVLMLDEVAGHMFDLTGYTEDYQTHLSSFIVVDFNPTSEELAKWIYKLVSNVISRSPFECKVEKVVWSETPKTQAVYSE